MQIKADPTLWSVLHSLASLVDLKCVKQVSSFSTLTGQTMKTRPVDGSQVSPHACAQLTVYIEGDGPLGHFPSLASMKKRQVCRFNFPCSMCAPSFVGE